MTLSADHHIPDSMPEDTWSALSDDPNSRLVDCRTSYEWKAIGLPDLSQIDKETVCVEWKQAPAMSVNPRFAEELDAALGGAYPDTLYFICRSGARSKEAATFITNELSQKGIACTCINVAEGFEGKQPSLSPSGWRDKGLPMKPGDPA